MTEESSTRWWHRVGLVLGAVLLFAVLVAPSEVAQLTPPAFLRIPIDGLVAVVLVLVLPPRGRRVAAPLLGIALGVLAVAKLVGIGFSAVLDRPFDPVVDWPFLRSAAVYVEHSNGRAAAIGAVVAAVLLALALLALVTLSFGRLTRRMLSHRTTSLRTAASLTAAWVVCVVAGVQIVPEVPVAAHDSYNRARQIYIGLRDPSVFAEVLANDRFRDTAGSDLLTALRGKDVIIAFVESYGRVAFDDPVLAHRIGSMLDAADTRLASAGFGSRSGFLTSPTVTGGSWLAHATLSSGAWVDNQRRYHQLVGSERMTLNAAFRRADWRTVAVSPATTTGWAEGEFFSYDRIYAAKDLEYRGPKYSFGTMPDQFTLSMFQRLERMTRERAPVMATLSLISSHAPWKPVPRLVGWEEVGDGSGYEDMGGGEDPTDIVFRADRDQVLRDFGQAITYTLESLVSYVETYGNDDLVLIVLGDHQPAPVITGTGASRDVPISIVSRDPTVLGRIAGWGWHDGLKPGPDAPVWRMDAFRDRFLTAFG